MPETLYEMVWRLYEGGGPVAHICPNCGNWCGCEQMGAEGCCYHDCSAWQGEQRDSNAAVEPDDYFERQL